MKNKNPIRSYKRSNTETPQNIFKTKQLQSKKSESKLQKLENK